MFLVAERMKWEQERVEWVGGGGYQEKRHVVRVERRGVLTFEEQVRVDQILDAICWWRGLF